MLAFVYRLQSAALPAGPLGGVWASSATLADAVCCCKQGINEMHAAFVADAVARCTEAVDAVDSAHEALVARGEAQAQLLEQTIAAQHAAAQRALAVAQNNAAATVRCPQALHSSLQYPSRTTVFARTTPS